MQMKTGHAVLKRHMSQWRPNMDKNCRLCNEGEETPLHLLHDCGTLTYEQNEYWNGKGTEEDKLYAFASCKKIAQLSETIEDADQEGSNTQNT